MSWFHQIVNYELGNFVQATPMLKAVSEIREKPIGVYFDTEKISSLYKKCSFIKILKKKPKNKPFATSEKPKNRKNRESNYECYFRLHAVEKGFTKPMPDPYVDSSKTQKFKKQKGKKYIALFHGCLATKSSRVKKKELNTSVLNYMISKTIDYNMVPVVLGSAKDKARFWSKTFLNRKEEVMDYTGELSLKDSVNVLSQCDAFMSNDTGLYHVAGALNIEGLVMWVNTDNVANKSPNSRIFHIKNRKRNFDRFKMAINRYLEHLK